MPFFPAEGDTVSVRVASYRRFWRSFQEISGLFWEDEEGDTCILEFILDNPNIDLWKHMPKATLKDFGDHSSVPSHKLDVGLVKPTSPSFAQTQETSLGNTAGYYLSPRYGLDLDLVKPTQKVIFDLFLDYTSVPNHELDVGPVKPVNNAFAWIQKIIFKNIRDYSSIPSYELNVGLLKPITNAFAWIVGGIDAIDNVVSLFPWVYKQGSVIVGEKALVSGDPVLSLIDPIDTVLFKLPAAIVGGKALVSGDPVLSLIDPIDRVLFKLLAAIDIGEDLFTNSIDNCFDVKTNSHGGLTPLSFEVSA